MKPNHDSFPRELNRVAWQTEDVVEAVDVTPRHHLGAAVMTIAADGQSGIGLPIYLGALTSTTVELAGELADGMMPFLWSPERIARGKAWGELGRAKSSRGGRLEQGNRVNVFTGR
jgi:alkanesulfonate monooxygenase SsuD/methylene tetrahydromethanopterin reductase-like flavin-dependent oxidoreductase (luciferase family)